MPMNPRLLRPIASGVHPEANAWRTAVVANGGSVSASTMKAVSKFCGDIDAAGIRDRFWRLNLFAGTGLNAALVPLYRGQSRTGTQYGNTTDTNNGPFVSGDYVETGASGGLTSNGTSKYLDTGVKADALGQTDRHLSMVGIGISPTLSHQYSGVDNFGCGGNAFWGILVGSAVATNFMIRAQAAATNSTNFSASGNAYILVSGNGSAAVYEKGVSVITGPAGAFTAPNLDMYIFGLNRCGSATALAASRQTAYSIGGAFTSGQATSFYNAMAAFQTSLSRA
jgi:hypothetical protein